MEPSIINTAITACAGIITCLIGIYAGKQQSNHPTEKKIREQQLFQVFTPISRIFIFHENKDTLSIIEEISPIINRELHLIPPPMLSEFLRVKSLESPKPADLSELQFINTSFFNWSKKTLGYPYNEDEILYTLLPSHWKKRAFFSVLPLLLCSISLVLITASWVFSGYGDVVALISVAMVITTAIISVVLFILRRFDK